jgi:monoterpene epsilon-lactone hydrolase
MQQRRAMPLAKNAANFILDFAMKLPLWFSDLIAGRRRSGSMTCWLTALYLSCFVSNAFAQMQPPESSGIASVIALRQHYFASAQDFLQRREAFDNMMAATPAPTGVTIRSVDANGVPAKLILCLSTKTRRGHSVILYLHGGGFYSGSSHTHRALAAVLAMDARADVLLIDYRLMPEHGFPAQIDDAAASYDWLLSQGYRADQIAIAGESVGGGLAVELGLRLRDAHRPEPAAIVVMSPVTDLAASGSSMIDNASGDPVIQRAGMLDVSKAYLAGGDPANPAASPLYADLHGLPPMLIQVGSREVLLDDSVRLARLAGEDDVPVSLEIWPGMIHQWQLFPSIVPDAARALADSGMFIHKRFSH